MPRRLAVTGLYEASVLEYVDRALDAKEVLVRTEIASGKHGTIFGMFDGRGLVDKRYDLERGLFVDDDENPYARRPTPKNLGERAPAATAWSRQSAPA